MSESASSHELTSVKKVKASEVETGAEIIIAEFRGVVDESREEDYDAREDRPGHWYLSLEGGEGAELDRDSTVYVVEARVAGCPDEGKSAWMLRQVDRAQAAYSAGDSSVVWGVLYSLRAALARAVAEPSSPDEGQRENAVRALMDRMPGTNRDAVRREAEAHVSTVVAALGAVAASPDYGQADRAERERLRADEAEESLAARTNERDLLEQRCAELRAVTASLPADEGKRGLERLAAERGPSMGQVIEDATRIERELRDGPVAGPADEGLRERFAAFERQTFDVCERYETALRDAERALRQGAEWLLGESQDGAAEALSQAADRARAAGT